MIIAIMRNVQLITHRGRIAAVVVSGQAVIEDTLSEDDFRHVQAMCLYAMETAGRGRPCSYTDHDADAYAREVAAA